MSCVCLNHWHIWYMYLHIYIYIYYIYNYIYTLIIILYPSSSFHAINMFLDATMATWIRFLIESIIKYPFLVDRSHDAAKVLQENAPILKCLMWKRKLQERSILRLLHLDQSNGMSCESCSSRCRGVHSSICICAVNCGVSIVSTCLYYSELHHLHQCLRFA